MGVFCGCLECFWRLRQHMSSGACLVYMYVFMSWPALLWCPVCVVLCGCL